MWTRGHHVSMKQRHASTCGIHTVTYRLRVTSGLPGGDGSAKPPRPDSCAQGAQRCRGCAWAGTDGREERALDSALDLSPSFS